MSTTFADLDLRTLADLEGPERAVLTVYLPNADAFETLGNRFKQIRQLLATQEAELEHFEENLKLVGRLVEESVDRGTEGWLLVACWALDVARAIPLSAAVEAGAWVGAVPYLRPVAELQDEYEDFCVVVADATSARVFRVRAQQTQDEGRVRGDVKNRVKKGGWSQKRYARRREKQLEQYAGEVAEAVAALDREEPFARLVLLGSEEARSAVLDALRTDLRAKVVAEASVSADDDDALLRVAFEGYFEGERAQERELWDEIRERSLGGEAAVVGPQRTLKAAQEGRLAIALAARAASLTATRCRACELVVYGTPDTCQRCGSADVFTADYLNELVEAVTKTGAEVEFVDASPELTAAGSVGGLLRY